MNPTRISIREFKSIDIVSDSFFRKNTISKQQAKAIELFQKESGQSFFKVGGKKLAATNWVGSFAIGNLCIDVVPKIDTDDSEAAMANLLHMVSAAGLMRFKPADISWLVKSDKPLITAFLELYVENLRNEWLRGPVRRYVTAEANRFFLKGKIVFNRHLRENALHKERFFTTTDQFTVDNQISRILKAALKVCRKHPLASLPAVRVKTLLCLFDEVSDERVETTSLRNLCIDRTISRFENLLNMAQIILDNVSPWRANSREPVYSLMFDMNEVFEKFIAAELKRAVVGTGYEVKTQSAARHLATRADLTKPSHKKVFWLRPDITVINPKVSRERPECIIDTKWKMLRISKNEELKPGQFELLQGREPVSQADMYQMYAYAHKYKCSVILIYPHHPGIAFEKQPPATQLFAYHCGDIEEPYIIMVCTVDITTDLGRATEREKLRTSLVELIKNLV